MGDLKVKVKKLVAHHLQCDESSFSGDTKFTEMGADSLDYVRLTMIMEYEFGVNISDDESKDIHSVNGYVALLESK